MPRFGPLLPVYALTLFISALLLFLVQPLIGKLIVPLLGGFPSVWNTCMVFFQAMLLAGYAYAHYSSDWLGERKQAVVHIGLIALVALPVLFFHLQVFRDLVPSSEDNVVQLVLGLLLLLLVSVGPPFFAVSSTAPLLQRWFANTAHPAAKDPYFLYAASNVGSLLALAGYLVVVEPYLKLTEQRWAWSVAYGLLVLLIAGCAVLFWKSPPAPKQAAPPKGEASAKAPQAETGVITAASFRRFAAEFMGPSLAAKPVTKGDEDVTPGRALRWVALAFVPSSLMLGVTTYITTDIAAIALLWVLPLALYLLSFILVFGKLPARVHRFMVLALPVFLLLLVFLLVSKWPVKLMWLLIALHLGVLFGVAMVCHGELARDRPAPRHLTTFYLLLSAGGVLGGLFNALLAPVLFKSLAEYPVAIALAAFLVPRLDEPKGPTARRTRWLDLLFPAALVLVCLEFFGVHAGRPFPVTNGLLGLLGVPAEGGTATAVGIGRLAGRLGITAEDDLLAIVRFAPPVVLSYVFVERPLRFGLGVAALLFVSAVPTVFDTDHEVLYRDRSFFGVLNVKGVEVPVKGDPERGGPDTVIVSHRLLHGNILHGTQFQGDDYKRQALTYYHRTGPIGQFLGAFPGDAAKKDVAVIGLGAGTMASYAERGQRYTFYEIDPQVKWISFDRKTYFSYVQDAKERGAKVNVVLGDARLTMEREVQEGRTLEYDLIVVDAFSSDAIPVHLMTRQALQIYRAKLKDNGIVAFHTSNRYLGLEPVVGNLAAAEGMACLMQTDDTRRNPALGKTDSTWVLVANREADLEVLPRFRLLDTSWPALRTADVPDTVLGKLKALNNKSFSTREDFLQELAGVLDKEELERYQERVLDHARRWEKVSEDPSVGVWTDDFSNLLRVFSWKGTR